MSEKPIGRLCPGIAEARKLGVGAPMFLRLDCGEAKDDQGHTFDLSTGMNGGMIVHCKETDRWFALGWEDFLRLAAERGLVDMAKPVDPPEEKKAEATACDCGRDCGCHLEEGGK